MDIQNIIALLDKTDKVLTLALNYNGGALQDLVWSLFSMRSIWIFPALVFIVYLCRSGIKWSQTVTVLTYLSLVILACDQISSTVMKPFFCRLRPSHVAELQGVIHLVGNYRGGLYGFVSSHAANSFGAVTFVSLLLRKRHIAIPLYIFALCVCYSRIYLGVHYLGDVVGGMFLGVFVANVVYLLLPRKCKNKAVSFRGGGFVVSYE